MAQPHAAPSWRGRNQARKAERERVREAGQQNGNRELIGQKAGRDGRSKDREEGWETVE